MHVKLCVIFSVANSNVCKTSFDFVLPEGKQIRKYQEELASPGKNGQNYIICAPTGTGKTLIVSMVISDHLKKFPNGRVVFVVNRIALAEQQCKEVKSFIPDLRAQHITSDCGVRLNTSAVFQINKLIVCTSDILLNELIMQELTRAKRISLHDITLLIFDECHNARKSNPYAVIMERYLKIKVGATGKIPQVVGLTASPGAGDNPSGEVEKSLEHLQFLCALLDALGGIKVVRENLTELVHYTNQPDFDLILTKSRDERDPFLQLLNDTMKPLEEWVEKITGSRSPMKSERRLLEYKSWVAQQRSSSEKRFGPNERDLRSTFNNLQWYCNALVLYHELNQSEALTFLQNIVEFPEQSKATEHEKSLQRSFENFYELAEKMTYQVPNPKLQRLRKLLKETFLTNPSSKGIIFVTGIKVARLMCQWLKGITELKALVRAEAITGHKLEAGGMSRESQQSIIDQFDEGFLNILVSTSVLEEGLNIVACNFVVRYNHVTTEIARVQSQGRARAKGSRCYAIMEMESPKVYQEQQNKEKEDLALEALDYLPQGDKLKEEVEKIQKQIILEKERQQKLLQDSKLFESNQVMVVCRHCDLELFWGGDLRKIADAHHVVIAESIFEKCAVKKHDRSRFKGDFEIARKLHCKNCDQDVGVIMNWPQRNLTFPAIKCHRVLFWVPEYGKIERRQWKHVPFIVQNYNYG